MRGIDSITNKIVRLLYILEQILGQTDSNEILRVTADLSAIINSDIATLENVSFPGKATAKHRPKDTGCLPTAAEIAEEEVKKREQQKLRRPERRKKLREKGNKESWNGLRGRQNQSREDWKSRGQRKRKKRRRRKKRGKEKIARIAKVPDGGKEKKTREKIEREEREEESTVKITCKR